MKDTKTELTSQGEAIHDRKGLSSRCPARRPLLAGVSLMRSDSFHKRHQWPLTRSSISQQAPNLTVQRVAPLLLRHVPAVLDAVFGGFHGSFLPRRISPRSPVRSRPALPPVSCHVFGDVMHPHFKRIFLGLMSLGRPSNRPADVMPHVWRCHCRPERTLSKSVHWLRPVGGRFTPVSACPRPDLRLPAETQTPVHPQYCTKGTEKKRVYSPPHPCAEPRGNGPWRPAYVRRAMRGLFSRLICSHFLRLPPSGEPQQIAGR